MNSIDQEDLRKPLWKISDGKNGEKYLTFSGTTSTASTRNQQYEYDSEQTSLNSFNQIRVYKLRWFILTVICLSNISNAINWIVYSPIADFTAEFYSTSYDSINFVSLSYLIISVPAGFFSFWIIDYFGIRASINLGSWFNFLGSLIKLFSSIDSADGKPLVKQDFKFTVLILGQCLCATAQPFIMFVTTKFANTWFAEDQRALANTIALGSNTLGILIGAFISPQIVDSQVKFVSEMGLLNLICCATSILPALMACFITRSEPKLPPSYSAIINKKKSNLILSQDELDQDEDDKTKFMPNLKIYLSECYKLLKSKDFLILFFSFGLSLGLFNALTTLIEQILCTRGYTDEDAGYFGGAMIISGIIGSIISGFILDKTKRFEEMAKICFCLSTLSNLFFIVLQLYDNDKSYVYYLILISFCLTGFFGLPLLPICMEMAVECVYPIPEATSTGLLFIAGQIVGIALILAYPKAAEKIQPDTFRYNSIQTCTDTNSTFNNTITNLSVLDFKYPLYGQGLLQVLISILFTIFFKCSYLRLRSEREKLAEKILNSARM